MRVNILLRLVLVLVSSASSARPLVDASSWLRKLDQNNAIELRSGAIIGAREFEDKSTVVFELSTQSRFGHVGLFVSNQDLAEIMRLYVKGAISDGDILKKIETIEGYLGVELRNKANIFDIDEIHDTIKSRALWTESDVDNRLFTPENIEDAQSILRQYYSKVPNPNLDSQLYKDENNEKKAFEDFWFSENRELFGITYSNNLGVILNMAPNGKNAGMHYSLPSYLYRHAPYEMAMWRGDFSIIQPKEDLSISEILTVWLYSSILRREKIPYNYSQKESSNALNCSEFVHHAYELIGYEVGYRQSMSTLCTGALNGGLRAASMVTGLYQSDKEVITPKSVMQSALYTQNDSLPEYAKTTPGLRRGAMEIVANADHLGVADCPSDKVLYQEWEKTGYLPRIVSGLATFGFEEDQYNSKYKSIAYGSIGTVAAVTLGSIILNKLGVL